jgi:hypothetical protein
MIRSLVGYATFAVLGVFAIKVAFKLLGLAVNPLHRLSTR